MTKPNRVKGSFVWPQHHQKARARNTAYMRFTEIIDTFIRITSRNVRLVLLTSSFNFGQHLINTDATVAGRLLAWGKLSLHVFSLFLTSFFERLRSSFGVT
jgi:hypothetical protein